MIRKPVTIQLSEGLDARPIALLVQEASQYASTVYIEVEEKQINAKSIMGMMSLRLVPGDEITIVTNGVDIISQSGQVLVDAMTRAAMVPIVVTQRMITRRDHASNRRDGIEQAKKKGKYTGRKPIEVDEKVLRQVNQELKDGLITVEEAMRRTKIGSKSTFYRRVRELD